MRKRTNLLILLLLALLLTACGNKAYNEALDKGYNALSAQAYDDAYAHFKEALEKKDTDEALKGKKTAKTMIDGWNAYDDGEWDEAIELASKILKDNPEEPSIELVIDDAEALQKDAKEMEKLEKELTEELEEIEQLTNQESYEEAKKQIQKLLDKDLTHEKLTTYQDDAKELLEIIEQKIKDKEEQQRLEEERKQEEARKQEEQKRKEAQEREEQQKKEEEKKEQENNKKPMSPEEAENFLRKELGVPNNVYVRYDRDEGDEYIIQVYEISGDDEIKHTATWGWYGVNKYTGKYRDALFD